MNVSLRLATARDFSLIQSIAYNTWPETFSRILSKKQISYMLEMMYSNASLKKQIEKHHRYLIASEGKENFGFASFEISYQGSEKTKLHKIYILPSAQNRGIGRQLINKIGDIAKDNQNSILSLNVNRNNFAFKFYEKMGFEKLGEENIDIGNGFLMEDFIMEKILV
jgi:ribosomal protein S18 acetylase RimI-like enzyme